MLEDLDTLLPRRGAHHCKVGRVLESLDANDASILNAALADSAKWSTNALHLALRQKGIDLGYQSLYRHRRLSCNCVSDDA